MGDTTQVVTGTIAAPPEAVFAVLADPTRHTEIDGAGMLRGSPEGAKTITAVGDTFVMQMNQEGLDDYVMVNTVIAFEPGRRIAWEPGIREVSPQVAEMFKGWDFSGYHYAWDLESTAEGGTAVTHTYDWTGVTDEKALTVFPRVSAEQMSDTIARLAKALA